MSEANEPCRHLLGLEHLQMPKRQVCERCVEIGASWVHLRTCQTCGVTLCCDSSPKRHATAHYHESGHPVVASAEPGERWLWCYVDEAMADY